MNVKSLFAACVASGAVSIGASAAMAGGVVGTVVDIAPIEAAPVLGAWEGAYAGGSLGYAFRGEDEVGLQGQGTDGPIGRAPGITDVEVSGLTASAHVGYRWQRGDWVVGPNLSIQGGSVDDSASGSFSMNGVNYDTTVTSKVKYVIDLSLKTGYLVDPVTMVYGVAGVSRGEFNYEFSTTGAGGGTSFSGSSSEDFSSSGYVLGFGVERLVSENVSAFGEFNYRSYGKTTLTTPLAVGEGSTRATPSHANIKVGVNFKF